MNDNDLIDELREGMRVRTDHAEVPDDFADRARRTARLRSARRAAAAGTPLLAAAGVATVLATSAGSGGSSLPGTQAPTVTVGGGQVYNTAYIVKRVQANLAADAQSGTVIQSNDYSTGQVNSDGSLVNLGRQVHRAYEYVAPDGTEYSRETYYNQDGSVEIIGFDKYVPAANGEGTDTSTTINPAKREYSQARYGKTPDPDGGMTPSLHSSPSQVQQALQSGQVTQDGIATVDGTQVIVLSVTVRSKPAQSTVLYVDAQTYQPLRAVWQVDGSGHVLFVQDWVPVTRDSIAKAKADSIPSGYTKADPAEVY